MVTRDTIDKVLDTYDLDEILELNELTEAEVLFFLVEEEFVKLPNPSPIDV